MASGGGRVRVRSLSSGIVLTALVGTALAWGGSPAAAVAPADAAGNSRESVIATYQSTLLPALAVRNDWTGSIAGCVPGTTGTAYQGATLTAINYVRGLAGLTPVTLDPAANRTAQAAALIMEAEGNISHFPPSTWPCYTADGADAAAHANLAFGSSGARAIVGYMRDDGDNNAVVGHRRWLINPGAISFGTGDTKRSNVLVVFGGEFAPVLPSFVPWPTAGSFPWQLEPLGRWSLGRIDGDFSAATVTMTAAGKDIPVTVTPPRNGMGDNTVSWEAVLPKPVSATHPADLLVSVSVAGIQLSDGSTVTHAYDVNLVDAAPRTAPGRVPKLTGKWSGTEVRLAWLPPTDDGGSAIKDYVLLISPLRAGAAKSYRCTTATLQCRFPNLNPKVRYRLTIVARNAVGAGAVRTYELGAPA